MRMFHGLYMRKKDYRTYSVKDVDGTYFDCDIRNCILSPIPSQLANMDPVEYNYLRRVPQIDDYNGSIQILLWSRSKNNTTGQYAHGVFDHEKEKRR